MAKNAKAVKPQQPEPQAPQDGDWGAATETVTAPGEATAPVIEGGAESAGTANPAAPQAEATSADVIEQQLDDKVREDVERQREELPKNAVDLALAETEKRIAKASNMKLAFDLLKELEGIPAGTKAEQRIKAACVTRVKKHCYDIQQGLPLVQFGANELVNAPGLKSAPIRQQRIEAAARSDRDLASVLEENKKLRAQVEQQTKKD